MQSIIRTTRNIHTFIKQSDIQSFKKCRFQAHLYTIETETDVALCQKDITASKKQSKPDSPLVGSYPTASQDSTTTVNQAQANVY